MKTSHEQAANILNKIFPGIEAHSGYIGNCSPCGSYDNRSFRIFTNIDIGGVNRFSIDIPAGEVSATTLARCVLMILRWDNRQTVSPAVAQMINAVRHAS